MSRSVSRANVFRKVLLGLEGVSRCKAVLVRMPTVSFFFGVFLVLNLSMWLFLGGSEGGAAAGDFGAVDCLAAIP